ncbi:MAG: M14 family zinc carboxypeptidase [Planctomycetota bacterium]|nr:M14 family zinc carboxypeptidase [Planctomycetota bacterium]
MIIPSALISLLFVAAQAPQAPQAPPEPSAPVLHLVRVELDSAGQVAQELVRMGLDVAHVGARGPDGAAPYAEVVVDSAGRDALAARDWSVRLVIEDMARFYAERLAAAEVPRAGSYGGWLNPPFGGGAMGGYYTFSEMVSVVDQIRAAYPTLVAPRASLGQSIEGRELWMWKVSDNPTVDENEAEARFDALHHAREPEGMQITIWFMLWLLEEYGSDPLATYLVDEREIYFVPCVNPDGYVYNQQTNPGGGGMWRKNRRQNGGLGSYGVDLNRNYPYQWGYDNSGSSNNPFSETYRGQSAASEPEVAAMVAFLAGREFGTALSIHTYSNLWLSPLGYIPSYPANWTEYDEVGGLATEVNGYQHGPASIVLYEANGTTLDQDHGVHGTLAWSPEIGSSSDGFWPPSNRIIPLAEENLLACMRTALAAGAWVRVDDLTVVEVGDGDGAFEGGESVALGVALRNSGRLSSGGLDVTLTTTSPHAEVLVGQDSSASLGPFSDGSLGSSLLLRIYPGTPAGTALPLEVTVSSGGWSETSVEELIIGGQATLATYDFEAGGDEGWSTGAPNDASTGIWTRVNPRGTDAQPEDDHTSGGGNTLCWVTGQGSVGGSLGENDVDGGYTSLLSPAFDLSGHAGARLEYWRWYSNNTGASPNADIFEVDLSDDGGASWTNARTVGPAGGDTGGGWIQDTLLIEDHVNLTSAVRVRFSASDLGSGSIVEAAIDDVRLTAPGSGDCPAPGATCVTTANSVGSGARIGSFGSTGVGDGAFTLTAAGLPANQYGIFFFGPNQISVPLGDGVLCVGGGLARLPVIQADWTGNAQHALDFNAPPAAGTLLPGSTWLFQFWYRDSGFGASGFNLSDALETSFCL